MISKGCIQASECRETNLNIAGYGKFIYLLSLRTISIISKWSKVIQSNAALIQTIVTRLNM